MFQGMMVALVTPFKDDLTVDYDKLEELIQWHVDQGTDGLIILGTTGESPTVTHDEHNEIISFAIQKADGRLPVIAGTGSNCTAEAVAMTRHAAKAGASGSLQVCPYYNKPTQEGLYRHFKTVAESADIPVILYNVPGRTGGKGLEPETVARLAEVNNVAAVKEASGSLDQSSAIASICDLVILSGDDSLTLPIMSVGGRGVISVVGNIVPADLKKMVDLALDNNFEDAGAMHRKLFPLCRAMFFETNPIPVKTSMKLMGMINGALRLPMCPMAQGNVEKLRGALSDYGLL
ncbi:MAG: 4-hydroxy-tetrahydrodipicolinate synthase [Planctomycetota bacterium]